MSATKKHNRARRKLPIIHIGHVFALCGTNVQPRFRSDLEYARYKRMGKSERLKSEKPYRICGRCLAVVRGKENKIRRSMGRPLLK